MPKKFKSQLGRAILNKKQSNRRRTRKDGSNRGFCKPKRFLQMYDVVEVEPITRLNTKSAVEISSLEDFVQSAMEAKAAFKELEEVSFVEGKDDADRTSMMMKRLEVTTIFDYHRLPIPRRPLWNVKMENEELQANEQKSFIAWRRGLENTAQASHLAMTPYEKNIEVWRQLWRVVERSDLLVHIVDARNPLAFISRDLLDYVKEVEVKSGREQKTVLVLINKADYLTLKQRQFWADYFQKEKLEVLFFSAISSQLKQNIISNAARESLTAGDLAIIANNEKNSDDSEKANLSRIFSKEELLNWFEERHSGEGKYVVGMVGYPNVGKSSIINALMGEKKVSVAFTPGKTKHFQTLNITERVTLCDCPGLVFPTFMNSKAELVLNGVIPIDNLRDFINPFALLALRVPIAQLTGMYSLKLKSLTPSPEEILDAYSEWRVWLLQSNVPDRNKAARLLLKCYVKGEILYNHPPPVGEELRNEYLQETEKTTHLRNQHNIKTKLLERTLEDALIPEVKTADPLLKKQLDVNTLWDQRLGNSKAKHARMTKRSLRKDKANKLHLKVLRKRLLQAKRAKSVKLEE